MVSKFKAEQKDFPKQYQEDPGFTKEPVKIVKEFSDKYKLGLKAEDVIMSFRYMQHADNKCRIIRAHNTLMLLINNQDGTASAIVVTADNDKTFVKSVQQIRDALAAAGVEAVTFTMPAGDFVTPFRQAGLEAMTRDMPISLMGGKQVPGQQIIVYAK